MIFLLLLLLLLLIFISFALDGWSVTVGYLNEGQRCDVCGEVSDAKFLATCNACRKVCGHIYCMRDGLTEVPEVWFCEACRSLKNIVSPKCDEKDHSSKALMLNTSGIISQENEVSNSLISSRFPGDQDIQSFKKQKILDTDISCCWFRKAPDRSEIIDFRRGKLTASPCPRNSNSRKVDSGKVKFLPTEDVLKMTSGAKVKMSISRGGSGLQDRSPNSVHYSMSKRSPAMSVNAAPKSFQLKSPSYRSLGHIKPLTIDNVTSPRRQALKSPLGISHDSTPSERLSDRKREEAEPSSCNVLSQTKTGHIDAEVCRSLSTCIVPMERGVTSEKFDEPDLLGLEKSAGNEAFIVPNECACEDGPVDAYVPPEENGTSNSMISSKFVEVLPHHPAIKAVWKGSFYISGAGSVGELYDGFHAHPPRKLSHKAYNFSKQLPGILQFEMQRRSDLWPDIFRMGSPDGHDIALYFFPSDFERSNQKYKFLLELMEKSDLTIRSCLGGVELLIFTSRHLPLDFQRLKLQFYLWGVYRSTKGRVSSISLEKNQVGFHLTSPEVLDMEGKKDVGRVNEPPQRPFPSETEVLFKPLSEKGMNIIDYNLYKNPDKSCERGDGSSSGVTGSSDHAVGNTVGLPPSLEVENEQCDDDPDIPPGFSVRISGDMNAISPSEMENETFESASIEAFKGLSLQPQKHIIGLESQEVSLNCHQAVASGNHVSLSLCHQQVVSHGPSMGCSLQSPSSSNLPVPPKSGLQNFLEKEKASVQQLEPYTLGFNLVPDSKSKNTEDSGSRGLGT